MKTCRGCQQPIVGFLLNRRYHPACRQMRRQALWRLAKTRTRRDQDISAEATDRRYTEALAVIRRRRAA